MNPRIVLHLLKSDWRGLRPLILCFWGFLLIAAWYWLSYSPGHFSTPPFARIGFPGLSERYGTSLSDFDGLFSQWCQMAALWASVGTSLSLAGILGYYERDRTLARPVRKPERFLARTLAFLLFLILPLLVVLAAIALVQGLGAEGAWTAVSRSAPHLVMKLAVVCLFGAVCGSWWCFAGGVMALYLASAILSLVNLYLAAPYWFGHPFLVHDVVFPVYLLPAVAVAIVLLATSRHMKAGVRMVLAISAIFLATRAMRWKAPAYYASADTAPALLADWSGKVRPVFADKEYHGERFENQQTGRPGESKRSSHMWLETPWRSEDLPEGTFADWSRTGEAELISGGEVIALTPKQRSAVPYQIAYNFQRPVNIGVLGKVLGKNGKPAVFNRSLSNYYQDDSEPMKDSFSAVTAGRHEDTTLVAELGGIAYRFEKIADVPVGNAVEVKVDGRPVHIRRIDHPKAGPMVDVAYLLPGKQIATPIPGFGAELKTPDLDWTPLIYFPSFDEYALLTPAFQRRETLVPGAIAVRQIFAMSGRPQDEVSQADLAGMRFILLRRVNVAQMRATFRGKPAPLNVKDRESGSDSPRHSGEGPPSAPRPDPVKATDKELHDWARYIDGVYDFSDYKARDLTEFVPHKLPALLAEPNNWSRGSTFLGEAVNLACPESRRGEVIAALNKRPRDESTNWIPDVIMDRGWVEAAAPQIRELAAAGPIKHDYLTQMLIARLEDPQTYPALLNVAGWQGWPEFYQITRRVPGIEPDLSKAVESFYQDAAKRNFRTPGRNYGGGPPELQPELQDKFYYCLTAAALGMPDAFANLLATWHAFNDSEKRRHQEYIRNAILLPGDLYDWKSAVKALAAREPSDFRYDTLAHLWVPADEPKP